MLYLQKILVVACIAAPVAVLHGCGKQKEASDSGSGTQNGGVDGRGNGSGGSRENNFNQNGHQIYCNQIKHFG
jgi:hypothetical protein